MLKLRSTGPAPAEKLGSRPTLAAIGIPFGWAPDNGWAVAEEVDRRASGGRRGGAVLVEGLLTRSRRFTPKPTGVDGIGGVCAFGSAL